MRQLPELFSTGDSQMRSVASDMVEHFLNGTANPYSNDILTNRVRKHQNTINFVAGLKSVIVSDLTLQNNNLYLISQGDDFKNKIKTIGKPSYNLSSDYTNGLKICLNGIMGFNVKITEFSVSGSNYSIKIEYILFDHFGLDDDDVTKSGWYSEFLGYTAQFGSWYVLQRYENCNNKYKLFVTYVLFEETYNGTLS